MREHLVIISLLLLTACAQEVIETPEPIIEESAPLEVEPIEEIEEISEEAEPLVEIEEIPTEPELVARASFSRIKQEVQGRVSIYRNPDGTYELVFDRDFRVDPCADMRVYFYKSKIYAPLRIESGFYDVGSIKSFSVDHSYILPDSFNISQYESIALYCGVFKEVSAASNFA